MQSLAGLGWRAGLAGGPRCNRRLQLHAGDEARHDMFVRAATTFPCLLLACRQLGIGLHELGEDLPLLDTATGQAVPADLDKAVER